MEIRINNKLRLIELIRSAMFSIDTDIELAKEQINQAYKLMQESLNHTFIVVSGLKPLVLNEIEDAKNYNQLTIIHDQLYDEIFVPLYSLASEKLNGTNILSFQRVKIHRTLCRLFDQICLIEPL